MFRFWKLRLLWLVRMLGWDGCVLFSGSGITNALTDDAQIIIVVRSRNNNNQKTISVLTLGMNLHSILG